MTRFCPVCRWDVAAITDFHSEYSDSCGICFELACDDAWIQDNYGLKLDRTYSCYNTGQVRFSWGQPQAQHQGSAHNTAAGSVLTLLCRMHVSRFIYTPLLQCAVTCCLACSQWWCASPTRAPVSEDHVCPSTSRHCLHARCLRATAWQSCCAVHKHCSAVQSLNTTRVRVCLCNTHVSRYLSCKCLLQQGEALLPGSAQQ